MASASEKSQFLFTACFPLGFRALRTLGMVPMSPDVRSAQQEAAEGRLRAFYRSPEGAMVQQAASWYAEAVGDPAIAPALVDFFIATRALIEGRDCVEHG